MKVLLKLLIYCLPVAEAKLLRMKHIESVKLFSLVWFFLTISINNWTFRWKPITNIQMFGKLVTYSSVILQQYMSYFTHYNCETIPPHYVLMIAKANIFIINFNFGLEYFYVNVISYISYPSTLSTEVIQWLFVLITKGKYRVNSKVLMFSRKRL